MALKEDRVRRRPPATLLTIEEAARRLSVSIRNIRHQIYLRKLPIVKVGRLVRIDERDLEAFIERGRVHWE
jgi:excisionase family DNA binding protein